MRGAALFPAVLGPSRRARWRRFVIRRTAAALLAGACVLAVTSAVLPPGDGASVVVTTRDVPAGSVLSATDLTTATTRAGALPGTAYDSAAADPSSLVGARVSGPLAKGEIVLPSRLLPLAELDGLVDGAVAMHLGAIDAAAIAVIEPGDRVDAYRAGEATPVASDVLVLAVTGRAEAAGASGLTAPPVGNGAAGLLVAVSTHDAARIAAAHDLGLTAGHLFAIHARR